MRKLGRWIKLHFSVEFVVETNWRTFGAGIAWTWNNNGCYFTNGPMLQIMFWAFALELIYKKNKAIYY